jgi:hypothetical protein
MRKQAPIIPDPRISETSGRKSSAQQALYRDNFLSDRSM